MKIERQDVGEIDENSCLLQEWQSLVIQLIAHVVGTRCQCTSSEIVRTVLCDPWSRRKGLSTPRMRCRRTIFQQCQKSNLAWYIHFVSEGSSRTFSHLGCDWKQRGPRDRRSATQQCKEAILKSQINICGLPILQVMSTKKAPVGTKKPTGATTIDSGRIIATLFHDGGCGGG